MAEFEIAAKSAPEDATLAANLGEAYAKANQPEKALQSLDHALELSPIPSMQNTVAWDMAEMNVHLDRAETIVKSAIASLSADTNSADLSALSRADTGRMLTSPLTGTLSAGSNFRQEIFRKPKSTSPLRGGSVSSLPSATTSARFTRKKAAKPTPLTSTRLLSPNPPPWPRPVPASPLFSRQAPTLTLKSPTPKPNGPPAKELNSPTPPT